MRTSKPLLRVLLSILAVAALGATVGACKIEVREGTLDDAGLLGKGGASQGTAGRAGAPGGTGGAAGAAVGGAGGSGGQRPVDAAADAAAGRDVGALDATSRLDGVGADTPTGGVRDVGPATDTLAARDLPGGLDAPAGGAPDAPTRAACEALERQWTVAWKQASACTPGRPNQCMAAATSGTIRCTLCPAYLNDNTEVTRLRAQWKASNCDSLYLTPCPVAACLLPTPGLCVPSDAGATGGECL